jgi:hypothetical protein
MFSTVKKYQLNCFIFKIYLPTLTHYIFSENVSGVSVLSFLLWLSNQSPPKLRLINITQYPPVPAAQPALSQEREVRKNHSAKGGDINIPPPPCQERGRER